MAPEDYEDNPKHANGYKMSPTKEFEARPSSGGVLDSYLYQTLSMEKMPDAGRLFHYVSLKIVHARKS
jgi:hypothetical protein